MPCSLPSTSCDSPSLLPQNWMLQLGFTGKKAGAVKGASKATNETAASTPRDAEVNNGPSASTSNGAQTAQDSAPDGQQKVCFPQQAFLRLQRRHAASQQTLNAAIMLCFSLCLQPLERRTMLTWPVPGEERRLCTMPSGSCCEWHSNQTECCCSGEGREHRSSSFGSSYNSSRRHRSRPGGDLRDTEICWKRHSGDMSAFCTPLAALPGH